MLGIKDLRTGEIVDHVDGKVVWAAMVEGSLVIAKMGCIGSTVIPRGIDYEIVTI